MAATRFVGETKLLLGRQKGYRLELESAVEEKKSANDLDFLDIDLNLILKAA